MVEGDEFAPLKSIETDGSYSLMLAEFDPGASAPTEHGNRKHTEAVVSEWRRMIATGEKTAKQIARVNGLQSGYVVRE